MLKKLAEKTDVK